jgi:CBS domain-containing membrane protein
MSRDVVAVRPGQRAADAAALLARHHIKALPVVDGNRRLLGILTQSDFFRASFELAPCQRHRARSDAWWSPRMSTSRWWNWRTRSPMAACTTCPCSTQTGVVGMVTQSDLVAALLRRDTTAA